MRSLALALLIALSGCATVSTPTARQQGVDLLQRGDYAGAATVLEQAVRNGDAGAWTSLGLAYGLSGREGPAVDALNMGARYGDPVAQQALITIGRQPPAADLAAVQAQQQAAQAQREAANAANTAATLQFLRSIQPPPPRIVNCTSTVFGRSVDTTCQ